MKYSAKLGEIAEAQFKEAVSQLGVGEFVSASSVTGGLFGQNVFVTTTIGEFVLRTGAHYDWQFPTERFFAEQLAEAGVPTPNPYFLSTDEAIFEWPFGFVLMERKPGVCFADSRLYANTVETERAGIAQALGYMAAAIGGASNRHAGRYDHERNDIAPFVDGHDAWLELELHQLLLKCTNRGSATPKDASWVLDTLDRLASKIGDIEVAAVLTDFGRNNVTLDGDGANWTVAGVFDLMECYYGDPVATLARQFALYVDEDAYLAEGFLTSYSARTSYEHSVKGCSEDCFGSDYCVGVLHSTGEQFAAANCRTESHELVGGLPDIC